MMDALEVCEHLQPLDRLCFTIQHRHSAHCGRILVHPYVNKGNRGFSNLSGGPAS